MRMSIPGMILYVYEYRDEFAWDNTVYMSKGISMDGMTLPVYEHRDEYTWDDTVCISVWDDTVFM